MFRVLVLVLFLIAMSSTSAYAETHEWYAEEPKPQGTNSQCVGTATYEGNTYTYGNWVPSDPDGREFNRSAYCHRILVTDITRLFKYKWQQELPESSVKVLQSP